MVRIIIIGIGNIGKRHLQAISNLSIEFEVFCYDKMKTAMYSVPDFCANNNIKIKNLHYLYSINDVEKKINNTTIVILSATSKNRIDTLKMVLNKNPLSIIAEKPLVQNLTDYEQIMRISKKNKVPIYINFIARVQPFYQKIYEDVKEEKEFVFYANMPKWGISTVGIHQFDLLCWLFRVNSYKMVASNLKSIYETKRKGFYDMVGSIILETEKRNICVFNNMENESIASIQIITSNKVYNIFEEQKKMLLIEKENAIELKEINFVYVSQYINIVIESIISTNSSIMLPNIEEGYIAHKILFEYMKRNNIEKLNIT